MKAIFLDVDGVLNNKHTRTTTFDGWYFVDDYLVKRLAQLVKQTGAKLFLALHGAMAGIVRMKH